MLHAVFLLQNLVVHNEKNVRLDLYVVYLHLRQSQVNVNFLTRVHFLGRL